MKNSLKEGSEEKQSQIDCLLIPLNDRNLLLPNITVSEVVPFLHLRTAETKTSSILGQLEWRGMLLPVVCYELLNGNNPPPPNPDARFIVLPMTHQRSNPPFYALLTQGIPKLVHLTEDDMQKVDAVGMGELDQMAVIIDGLVAMIPDLAVAEKYILGS